MGELRVMEVFYPKVLSEKEHVRMSEVIKCQSLHYESKTDDCLIECGLLELHESTQMIRPRTTENGHNFYYEPGTFDVNFFWLAVDDWGVCDEEL